MWLDRFSGPSTPVSSSPPQSRNYSPAPKRSSHLAPTNRTSLGLAATRSSTSLDLSTNSSNASLPSLSRLTNGSSLRQEQRPPPDVKDPLLVLRTILSRTDDKEGVDQEQDVASDKARAQRSQLAQDIDFGGLGIEDYLNEAYDRETSLEPQAVSLSSSKDDRHKYQDFHRSIAECDDVLDSVESYLTSFQAELGQVSAEIENLQARSILLNAKLENRRKVEKLLGPAVETISLSPVTVKTIAEGPIDEHFLHALQEIETRSTAIKSKGSDSDRNKALEDVKPLLDDLRARAIERIRDYVVAQIKALRSPNINAQVIQQQTFIRYKDLYIFLARNHPVLAEEIGQAYVNTMKWYYSSNFSRYQHALEKIQLHVFDQHDTLGADPASGRRNIGSTPKSQAQHDAFGLGRRIEVLRSKNHATISSYLAEENKTLQYLETPFYNFNQALIDNVCAEYAVITELFSTSSFHQVSRKAIDIFEPTFALGQALTKQLVDNTTDCLGVLLCVRLNQQFAFAMQRRKVPVADSYINYTNILLWPRFQMIMDLHCESLKRVPSSANRGASAAFSLAGGHDASKASLAPHSITQRFGQFLQGILSLSSEAGDDEPVANSIIRLRGEFEILMGKLAKGAGDASKRGRFLYNNYSLVLTIISDTQGKLAEEQKEHFSALLKDTKR